MSRKTIDMLIVNGKHVLPSFYTAHYDDRGQIAPDGNFLLKRLALSNDADKTDTYRRAVLELLRNHQHLGIPLSQRTLDLTADELERLWWPNRKAEKRRRRLVEAEALRNLLDKTEAMYRQDGVALPRSMAKDGIARRFGFENGEALRKHLQANRLRRKPRG
jgi:hypothetical protein